MREEVCERARERSSDEVNIPDFGSCNMAVASRSPLLQVRVPGVKVPPRAKFHDDEHLPPPVEDFDRSNDVGVIEGLEDVDLVLELRDELVGHTGELDGLEGIETGGLGGTD